MISHRNVNDVFGASFRHVAGNAVRIRSTSLFLIQAILRIMTGKALLAVESRTLVRLHFLMRIVAVSAANPARSLREAFALMQAIWVMVNFEFVHRLLVMCRFEMGDVFVQ